MEVPKGASFFVDKYAYLLYNIRMKNRRIVYIHDDNLEFYENMDNKSEFINQKLRELRAEDAPDKSNEFEEKIRKMRGRSSANSSAE